MPDETTKQVTDSKTICAEVESLVSKGRGDVSYVEASLIVIEKYDIDFAYFRTLLTPKLVESLREDNAKNRYTRTKPRPAGFDV